MKSFLALMLLGFVALSGCAIPIATLYVRPADGAAVRCDASGFGWGLMGLIAIFEAQRLRDNCIRDAITLGFVPINGALPTGIRTPQQSSAPTPAWIRDLPGPRPTWCSNDMIWDGRSCKSQ
jgi:hypothetical protein